MTTATSIGAALAEHVLGLRLADVPSEVRERASLLLLDALGVGLYGSTLPVAQIVHDEARERYRDGKAAVWGRKTALAAPGAALVNATQAHAFELDDYHPGAKLHPGAVVVPAALAVLSPRTSGCELLSAITAAYDVMIRVALAMGPGAVRMRGWHLTGLAGPFGAAAVAGRLLGLDRTTLVHAFGIAGSFAAGTFAFSREGAMTKRLHAGRAAEGGVLAVRLAARGLTGPSDVLEADDGGLLGAVSDVAVADRLYEELGTRFDLAAVAVKPYPCCGSVHSSIDCALAIRREYGIDADDVAEIVVRTGEVVRRQCGFAYGGHGGALEAQMSLAYCVAVALTDGEVTPRQFSAERLRDPAPAELARRVVIAFDEQLNRVYPTRFSGRITVRLRSGETFEHAVAEPSGSPGQSAPEMVREKFRRVTATVLPAEQQERLIELTAGIDQDAPPGAALRSATLVPH